MSTCVIFLPYLTNQWLHMAFDVRAHLLRRFDKVYVVDISNKAFPSFSMTYNGDPDFFISVDFDGYNLKDCEVPLKGHFFPSQGLTIRKDNSGILVRILNFFEHRAQTRILVSASKVLGRLGPNAIVLPNGRFSYQKSIASHYRNLVPDGKIFFYETLFWDFQRPVTSFAKSFFEPRYFLQDFPIHSRVRLQKALLESELPDASSKAIFYEWLNKRSAPKSEINSFSSRWSSSQVFKPDEAQTTAINLFMTSSTDEFWALGEEWMEDAWQDQYEAFDAVIRKLKKMGETEFTLRIHPNLANKSFRFVRAELKRIDWLKNRHPELVVIGPKAKVNTYSLIGKSKRIFVSLSLAGLEASGLGKPVWCVSANNYDLSIDVRKLHSDESVTESSLAPWDVDHSKAHEYVAKAMVFGQEYEIQGVKGVTERSWMSMFRARNIPYWFTLLVIRVERPFVLMLLSRLEKG